MNYFLKKKIKHYINNVVKIKISNKVNLYLQKKN